MYPQMHFLLTVTKSFHEFLLSLLDLLAFEAADFKVKKFLQIYINSVFKLTIPKSSVDNLCLVKRGK